MSHFRFSVELALDFRTSPVDFSPFPFDRKTPFRKMKTFNRIIVAVLFAGLFSVSAKAQDNVEEQARNLLEQHKGSLVVVTVKGMLEATTSGDPLPARDQQRRTLGVTIGDDGLLVVSNAAIDASIGLEGQQAKLDDDVVTIKSAKTEFSDVEISYGDSTLLHGKVVRCFRCIADRCFFGAVAGKIGQRYNDCCHCYYKR